LFFLLCFESLFQHVENPTSGQQYTEKKIMIN